eukprot:INCI16403.3.p1 GENE.INCI16403.3~~INCI16403.3.p1  ORF type:complete len:1602 (-),score=282.91 INCI16403.3:4837-9642(-)
MIPSTRGRSNSGGSNNNNNNNGSSSSIERAGSIGRSFLSNPHFSLSSNDAYKQQFPDAGARPPLPGRSHRRSESDGYSVIQPAGTGLASTRVLHRAKRGQAAQAVRGSSCPPVVDADELARLDGDGRLGLAWRAFSDEHCKHMADSLRRDMGRIDQLVENELQQRTQLTERPYSARDQRNHVTKVALPKDVDMKLVWLTTSAKRKLLGLRRRMALLEKYLQRLASAPAPAFEQLHKELHDNVLDAVQTYQEETRRHVAHFEQYFGLQAHLLEIQSKIKYHTHDLELEGQAYARLIQRIFFCRLKENARINRQVCKVMRHKRLSIFFRSWARKTSVTHVLRGLVSTRKAQQEIFSVERDVVAKTKNIISDVTRVEIMGLPNVNSFVNAHPQYHHIYSQNFLKDACDHVDESIRWMLQATVDDGGDVDESGAGVEVEPISEGTDTSVDAADVPALGRTFIVNASRYLKTLSESCHDTFARHCHREARRADVGVQASIVTYTTTATQHNSLPADATHWFVPKAVATRDPMLESELHRVAAGYQPQQRRLHCQSGAALGPQPFLGLSDALLVAAIILGQKQWHDDRSDEEVIHRDSLVDCINRYFTMQCLEDHGSAESLRGRFLSGITQHSSTSPRLQWFAKACGRDGSLESEGSSLAVCDFLLYCFRCFHDELRLLSTRSEDTNAWSGLGFDAVIARFGNVDSELPLEACKNAGRKALCHHLSEDDLLQLENVLGDAAVKFAQMKHELASQQRQDELRKRERRVKERARLQQQQFQEMQRLNRLRLAKANLHSSSTDLTNDTTLHETSIEVAPTAEQSLSESDNAPSSEYAEELERELEAQRLEERLKQLAEAEAQQQAAEQAVRKSSTAPSSVSFDDFVDIVMGFFERRLSVLHSKINSSQMEHPKGLIQRKSSRVLRVGLAPLGGDGGYKRTEAIHRIRLLCAVLVPDVPAPDAVGFLTPSLSAVGRTLDELAAFVIDMSPMLRHDALLQAMARESRGVDTTGDGKQDSHTDDGTEAHRILRQLFLRNSNCAPVSRPAEQTVLSTRAALAASAARAAEERRDPFLLFEVAATAIANTRISSAKLKLIIRDQKLFHQELKSGDPDGRYRRVMDAIDGYSRPKGLFQMRPSISSDVPPDHEYIYAFLVHQAVPEELTWGEVLCVYARAASELQRPLTALAQELASHAPFRASETTALIKRVQNVFHFYCNEDKTGSPSALGQRRVHLCRRQLVELLVDGRVLNYGLPINIDELLLGLHKRLFDSKSLSPNPARTKRAANSVPSGTRSFSSSPSPKRRGSLRQSIDSAVRVHSVSRLSSIARRRSSAAVPTSAVPMKQPTVILQRCPPPEVDFDTFLVALLVIAEMKRCSRASLLEMLVSHCEPRIVEMRRIRSMRETNGWHKSNLDAAHSMLSHSQRIISRFSEPISASSVLRVSKNDTMLVCFEMFFEYSLFGSIYKKLADTPERMRMGFGRFCLLLRHLKLLDAYDSAVDLGYFPYQRPKAKRARRKRRSTKRIGQPSALQRSGGLVKVDTGNDFSYDPRAPVPRGSPSLWLSDVHRILAHVCHISLTAPTAFEMDAQPNPNATSGTRQSGQRQASRGRFVA